MAHELKCQLRPVLGDLHVGVLHDRGRGAWPGVAAGLQGSAADGGQESRLVHLVHDDAGAQVRIGQAALFVLAHVLLRQLAENDLLAGTPAGAVHAAALMLQEPLGHRPAAVQRSDQVLLGHLHVGDEGLAEGRVAGDQPDRPDLDAGLAHREDHEGDAFVLLGGVGADQAEDHVGPLGARRPDLLTVDQEVVTLVLGPGLERGEVRPGARLGEALAPADAAMHDVGDVLLLLGLGPVLQKGRPEHADAHADDGVHRADRRHLLLQNTGLLTGEPAAAVLGRPGGYTPALGAHALLPDCEVALGRLGRHDHGLERREVLAQGGGEIRLKPVPGFGPEGFESTVAKIGHQKYSLKFNILCPIIP